MAGADRLGKLPVTPEVAWHQAECGSYRADLEAWLRIAGREPKRILDLGCGSGRVATHLAAAGHHVTGLDSDVGLLDALAAGHPGIETVCADARNFELGRRFDLVLAPMQLLQLFLEPADRLACLAAALRHLAPGGVFAAALVDLSPDSMPPGRDLLADQELTPDRFELEPGTLALSRPVGLVLDADGVLHLDRLRQIVVDGSGGSDGEVVIAEQQVRHSLRLFTEAEFEAELRAAGFTEIGWRRLAGTEAHMGSLIAVAQTPR